MDSSPGKLAAGPSPSLPRVAGVKRPAPSLLPPFEPLSSSPGLPRLVKKARGSSTGPSFRNAYTKYPTPVPTSSTGILSSSPPRVAGRPQLQRTMSAASERIPLGAVSSIELSENGNTLLMGRSSNSSNYQLSANRLISRVHVKARYVPATEPLQSNKVEIVCTGWNGLKLHCQARTWELSKGDTFTSETENAEIMIDVQDARVRIQWPKKDRSDLLATLSDSSWDSPQSAQAGLPFGSGVVPGAPGASSLQSSPLRRTARIASPESPTPVGAPASTATLQALLSQHAGSDEDDDDGGVPIKIYEDGSSDELDLPKQPTNAVEASFATEVAESFSSELSELQSDDEDNGDGQTGVVAGLDDDPDEENDPIIHSFGPFGANLSDRLASITTRSPKVGRPPLSRIPSAEGSITSFGSGGVGDSITVKHPDEHQRAKTPQPGNHHGMASDRKIKQEDDECTHPVGLGISMVDGEKAGEAAPESPVVVISERVNVDTVRNHLINQLAFSRLSSSPLSTIMNNLPAEERRDLTREALRYIIEQTSCAGVIPRQGKDAAGKPLESEYYYVPEADSDESRRAAVVDGLRKPSLRNCRKQHKQYYWKRPRTP